LVLGTEEPLVTSVEPWNSVRVTLKVSRDSAALLQTLARQQDPKLLDIGVLSVQVEGSNPVCLDRPAESSSKLNTTGDKLNVESSVRFSPASSALAGSCHSAVRGHVPYTAVQEVICSRASGPASGVNQSWHPLVDQKPATLSDDATCSWDPFGYNGLSVDPFQFSADDLLTRMLADVPAPKRRQRARKASAAASATHSPFLLSNPLSLTAHEDLSSKVEPSNALSSVGYGSTVVIPNSTQSCTAQRMMYFDKNTAAVSSGQQLYSPYHTQVSDRYSMYADKYSMPFVSSQLSYSHPQQNISSALPVTLDSLMTVSNHTVKETRSTSSDRPPVKKRRSRNATVGHVEVGAYGAVTDVNQQPVFRDVCNGPAVSDAVKSAEMHMSAAPCSRYSVRSPRALWSDTAQSHSVVAARYPHVDVYRFRLPYQQSCSWPGSSSSYMYNDTQASGALPFTSDVQKPFSVAGGVAARTSFTVSLPSQSKLAVWFIHHSCACYFMFFFVILL